MHISVVTLLGLCLVHLFHSFTSYRVQVSTWNKLHRRRMRVEDGLEYVVELAGPVETPSETSSLSQPLPDLKDFSPEKVAPTEKRPSTKRKRQERELPPVRAKVDRSNEREYAKMLTLDPFADADESNFVEEYDILQSVFGRGSILGIPIPFLQSGHLVVAFLSLLSAAVYDPGTPLTSFPPEIRAFLWHSMKIIYTINAVIAVQAYFQARRKNMSGLFWSVKTFLLGGIATYELQNTPAVVLNNTRFNATVASSTTVRDEDK